MTTTEFTRPEEPTEAEVKAARAVLVRAMLCVAYDLQAEDDERPAGQKVTIDDVASELEGWLEDDDAMGEDRGLVEEALGSLPPG